MADVEINDHRNTEPESSGSSMAMWFILAIIVIAVIVWLAITYMGRSTSVSQTTSNSTIQPTTTVTSSQAITPTTTKTAVPTTSTTP